MSLAAKLPPLDDRTFDTIVAEARQRIPRYTPEWTDFNDGDTGIALVELFAWMTEMLIFRMNQVPELNYLKFLELTGIRLEATPHRHPINGYRLYKRTEVMRLKKSIERGAA